MNSSLPAPSVSFLKPRPAWSAAEIVKPCVVSSASGLRRIDNTQLKNRDEGLAFGTSVPGTGPATAPSPAPMTTNSVRPRIARPEGPDGSPSGGAKPEGNPSTRVRRAPVAGSTIEIRPEFGPLPASATNKLPFGMMIALVGVFNLTVRTEVLVDLIGRTYRWG